MSRRPPKATVKAPPPTIGQVTYGINALGLGPNVMGLLLTAGFLGVYFGSSYYTKKWIMANRDPDEPLQPAKSFKELKIVKTE